MSFRLFPTISNIDFDRVTLTFSLISLFLRTAFSCDVSGLAGSSSVAVKCPSATGTGLRRDDPPPDDTEGNRCQSQFSFHHIGTCV